MNKISEEGKKQISDALDEALKHQRNICDQFQAIHQKCCDLSKALHCPHDELEDASTEGVMQTRCKKCGFIWNE